MSAMGITVLPRLGLTVLLLFPFLSSAQNRRSATPSGAGPASLGRNAQVASELIRGKNFSKASEVLEAVIRSKPLCGPQFYMDLATCRLNMQEKDRAVETCERGLELYPESSRLDRFYVALLRATCTKGERKVRLGRGLQRKPNSPVYMIALSEVLLAEDPVGLQAQIEPLVRKAALALPLDPEAHYLYGQWACLNDRHEVSIRELTRALALIQDNDRARMQTCTYLAITYERLGEPAKAEQAYRDAIALNRGLPSPEPGTLMQYAKFLQDEQREAEAQEVITEILRFAPSFGLAHLERGKFLAGREEMEAALAEGELALRYAGDDVIRQRAAHAFLARAYNALGRAEQAKLHLEWIESRSRR